MDLRLAIQIDAVLEMKRRIRDHVQPASSKLSEGLEKDGRSELADRIEEPMAGFESVRNGIG